MGERLDLTPLLTAAPQLGGAGILVIIIVLLLRVNAQMGNRHDAELARINADHDNELTELRSTITELRTYAKELEQARRDEAQRALEAEKQLWRDGGGRGSSHA